MSVKAIGKTDGGYKFQCGTYPTANYDALLTKEPRDHITRLIRSLSGHRSVEPLMFIRNNAREFSASIVPGTTENYYLVFVYAELDEQSSVELKLKYNADIIL